MRMRSSLLALIFTATLHGGARATPGDYQSQVKMGPITLAADFSAHSVTTADAVYSTEDYVVVDAGLFGPAGSHVIMNWQNFSIRVNGKKPIPSENVVTVYRNLKDPEWEESVAIEAKASASKTSIGSGGGAGGGQDTTPPPKPKMPIALERKMEQRAEKAALAEGDRPLPDGGLLFFSYHGKTKDIHSIELIYVGAAGKATLGLH